MVRSLAVLCLFASGCDRLFGDSEFDPPIDAPPVSGVDLDDDGVPDVMDPCLAPPAEQILDEDADLLESAMDPCPFQNPNGDDPENDMVGSACDAFSAIGMRRCAMAFTSSGLNAKLWAPAPNGEDWIRDVNALRIPERQQTDQVAQLDATEDLLAINESGTVTASVTVTTGAMFDGRFLLLLSSVKGGEVLDVGCVLRFLSGGIELDTVGEPDVTGKPVITGGSFTFQLRGSVMRGVERGGVKCEAIVNSVAVVVEGSLQIPPNGRMGFVAFRWPADVSSLDIVEHR